MIIYPFRKGQTSRKVKTPLFLDGYVYYDLFNQILGSNMVQLVSPLITSGDDTQLCFSFWYAAFGAGDSAVMQIIRQDNSSGESITDKVQLFYASEGNIAGRLISQSVVVDVTVRSVNLNFIRVNKLGMTITKFYTDFSAMHV